MSDILSIDSFCRNINCKKSMTFRTNEKMSKQLYCCESCWIKQWVRTGNGLVHPLYINSVKTNIKSTEDRVYMDLLISKIGLERRA